MTWKLEGAERAYEHFGPTEFEDKMLRLEMVS